MLRRFLIPLLMLWAVAAAFSDGSLSLTFLGDIMAHTNNTRMQDFRAIYADVREVLGADDITVANLEFPVDQTSPVAGYPAFNAHRDYLEAAIESGVQLFSVANNHSLDLREDGIYQTLRSLDRLRKRASPPVEFSGLRGNPLAPFRAAGFDCNGVRVGFLAATQFVNQWLDSPYVHIVDYNDAAAAQAFLDLVRSEAARFDLFIVSYHGDEEYMLAPARGKRAFFRQLLENGAHIVFGHHPHVLQEFERTTGPDGDRLIMYSMGNFISGQTWSLGPADWNREEAWKGDSMLLSVDVTVSGGKVSIARVEPLLISNYRNARGDIVVGRLEELARGTPDLGPAWTAYYRKRLDFVRALLAGASGAADGVARKP